MKSRGEEERGLGGPADPERTETKRPYLRADDRRRQLLDAAAALVARRGPAHLTMMALAEEAGTSRQLVYRHFPDTNALLAALLTDRFGAMGAAFDESLGNTDVDPMALLEVMVRRAMALGLQDRTLLKSVFSDFSQRRPELAPLVETLRERIINRWANVIDPVHHRDPVLRAEVWALVSALFGLWDLYDVGQIDIETAIAVMAGFLGRITPGHYQGSGRSSRQVAPPR